MHVERSRVREQQVVLGVIGTFNSGCAKLEIPIANRAGGPRDDHPGEHVSGLTHDGPGTTRVSRTSTTRPGCATTLASSATDDFQGSLANAQYAKESARRRSTSSTTTRRSARASPTASGSRANKLDIDRQGFEPWDAKASSYEAIGERIKATGAQSVYFGGIVCNNGVKLLKDIYAVVGKGVLFVGPDGWTPFSATAAAGAAAQGMFVSVAGLPLSKLGKTGKKFLVDFAKYQGKKGVDPYAVYAAQTAQIMLDAIARSNGTRLAVVRNALQDAGGQRHHGHVPLRREGRHLPDEDHQLLRSQGHRGGLQLRGYQQGRPTGC